MLAVSVVARYKMERFAGGSVKDSQSPIENRDLLVIVEALLNQVRRGQTNDPGWLTAEIRTTIWFAAQLHDGDLVAKASLDVASTFLFVGRPVEALQQLKKLLALRG
jgi:hypothetical protein